MNAATTLLCSFLAVADLAMLIHFKRRRDRISRMWRVLNVAVTRLGPQAEPIRSAALHFEPGVELAGSRSLNCV
jgi:hypothetical protein